MGPCEVLREQKIAGAGDSSKKYTLLQKYMCGFLNSVGGKIVFGVDDKSSAIEMVPLVRARADETAEQLQVLANAAKVKTLAPLVVS